MGWLDGRVALVTGGGSGIGYSIVERFLREGARVTVLEREAIGSGECWSGDPASSLIVQGDVTVYADNVRAVARTIDTFGRLDILVANVGIHDGFVTLDELSDHKLSAAFDEVFEVNVKAYLYAAKAALRALVDSRGTMLFTVSNAGLYPGGGGPIYTASKHAVVGLIRQLAHELAPAVRVNGVAPAGTVTDLRGPSALGQDVTGLFSDGADWEARIRSSKPLDIVPTGGNHAGAYVLLASKENSAAITAEIISSDGGLAARGLSSVASGHRMPGLGTNAD